MAQIDAPALNCFTITFSSDSTLQTPLLRHFISHWEAFQTFNQAEAVISQLDHGSIIYMQKGATNQKVPILVIETRHLWSFGEVFSMSLPPLTGVECLDIHQDPMYWKEQIMENTRWVELLHPFNSVTNLVLYNELAEYVLPALQKFTEDRVMKVLPSLKNILIVGPQSLRSIQEAIEQFVMLEHNMS